MDLKRIFLHLVFSLLFIFSAFAGERFWVGCSGNWNDTKHWSEKSGGTPGASVPTSTDDVTFDSKSFSQDGQQVIIDADAECRNMTWKNIITLPVLAGDAKSSLYIYGSLSFAPEMTNDFKGQIVFNSTQTGNTIFSANQIFHGSVVFDRENGEWKLLDDIRTSGEASIYLIRGTLNTNSKNILCQSFIGSGDKNRSLILGSSKIIVRTLWDFSTTANLFFDAGKSNILLPKEKNDNTFIPGNLKYNDISIASGNCVPSGNPCAFFTITLTMTPDSCNGPPCNGTATGTISGGTGPFTYNWLPSGQTTTTATGLCAGTPSLEVIDGLGNICDCFITVIEPPVLNANITPPAPVTSCFGVCDGSATASGVGGVSPYTYSWNTVPVQTTPLGTGLCAGTNTVTVTDSYGCIKIKTFVVGQPASLVANGSSTTIACFGNCTGSACVAPTGGTAPYTYLWSPSSATTSCLTGLCVTPVLTCTVTDASGCIAVYSTSITEPPALTVTVTSTNVSCNSACDGTATATVSGGVPSYTYSWTGGCVTSACTGLCAGNYTLTVTDANGCTITATVSITQPPALTLALSKTDVSCFGQCDGSVTATAGGGATPYTYAWSNGCITSACTGLCAGTYSITVTDFNGCTITGTITVTEPPLLVVTMSTTSVTCNGLCNGSVTATVAGGTTPYTYAWSNGCITSACTGLCAGTYSITVTDNNGCIATGTITVNQPAPLLPNLSMTPALCNGICDGTVTSSATGGTPPYTYTWSNGCTTSTCSGLCAGTYTLTLQDFNGCTATGTITVTQPFVLSASIVAAPNPLNCNGDCNGTAVVSVSGGSAPFTYLWSTGPTATTASITGLCSGSYSVTVTDANGCTASASVLFLQPTPLTVVVSASNPSCNGASNGSLCAIAGGGTPGYTFLWQPVSQTTACITGLGAGTYTLTVTDSKGCIFTSIDTLVAPLILNANAVVVNNVSCAGPLCDGSASSTPAGGTSPYTFLWSNGQTTSTATGLCAGSFTVTVTDANGCFDINIISITQPIVLSSSISSTTSSCTLCTGIATVTTSGGTTPYTFLWCDGQTTSAAVGLCIGTCSVTVTDANGCTNTLTATINPVVTLSVTVSNTSVGCFGSCDGIATANPSGGGAPYTYQWNAPIQTTQSATGLCAGTYTITVADINGCIATNIVSFTNPPALTTTVSSTTASCGICNGTASVSSGGGTGSYTYSWNIFPAQTTSTATGLCAGTYSVTVNDSNNCTTTNTVSVGSIPAISDNPSITLATCGGSDGAICVSPSGGTPGYTYLWSPGGSTTACITGLAAGIDTVIITDAAGCSDTFAIAVGNIGAPTYTVNSQINPSCTLSCNGFISISASSAFPPIDFLWNPGGQTTTSVAGLCAGTYIIQITDAVPCTTFASITLTDPPQMSSNPSITNVTCNGGNNGSICLSPSGGIAPYTFTWSNGQSTSCATGLTAGTYTVILADASGCDDTVLIPVTEPAALSVTITSTNVTCNGNCDGTAMATVTGGTPLYAYLWSTGAPIPPIVLLCPNIYTITVTDANGCTATASVTITEPAALTTTITSTNITCNSLCDGTATLNVAGGTLAYTFSWNDPGSQTTQTATGLCAGNYVGTVTDANGCTSSQSVTITEPAVLSVTVTTTNTSCFSGCDGTATASVSGGTAPYTYSWNPSAQTTTSATGLCAGSYTLDVTDANGCITSNLFSITEPTQLQPGITNTSPSCFGGCDGTATSSPIGGTPPYTFLWSNGQTTSTATGLCAGTHTLILSDANGCSDTTTTLIVAPTPVTQSNGVADATCLICNGSITVIPSGGTPPYTFFWSNGQTTGTITGLCAEIYIDTVMDANGCISVDTIIVNNTTGPVITVSSTNVTCAGACDGTGTVTSATGDGPPWIYLWFPTNQTTVSATGLCPLQHIVSVTDTNGCMSSTPINITEPAPLASNPTITNATCFGICDGNITLNPTGGTGAYTFNWAGGQTTSSISAQCAGNYTVIITDANGCVLTTTLTIGQNTILTSTVTPTNDSCNASCDGTATIVVSGGTLPYTYIWTGGQTTSTATGLCAGTFTITATDAIGCIHIDSAIITEPSVLASNISGINPLCNVSCDGSVSSAPTGGTPPYTYAWSNGCSTSTCTGLCAGTYTLVLTDTNNCSVTNTVTLTAPAALSSSVTVTNDSCNGDCNGTAIVTVSGGTVPYTYLWCSGQTTTSVTGLCAGTCSLIITDANGCTKIDSAVITEPLLLVVNISGTNPICNSSCDGSVSAAPTGGTLPYTYAWSNGCSTSPCTGLCAGTYTLMVTDANGCTDTASITLVDPVITTSVTVTNASCNSNCDGTATVTVSGGAAPYTYLWCNGETTTSATGLCVGTCTIIITDANGCTKIDSAVITQPNILASNITGTNPLCNGFCDGSVSSSPTGGTPPYTFLWSNGCTTSSCTGLCTGTYSLTLTDANGCTAIDIIVLIDPPILTSTDVVVNASCINTIDGSICVTPSGGTPPYTYLWNNAQTDSCATALGVGVYSVTITDANGCSFSDSMTVGAITIVVANAGSDVAACFGDTVMLCSNNINATISIWCPISWTPADTDTCILVIPPAGINDFVVIAMNGLCSDTDTVSVTIYSLPAVDAGTDVTILSTESTGLNGTGTGIYLWSPSIGLSCTTCANPTANPSVTTTYTLTVTDTSGCIGMDTVRVTIIRNVIVNDGLSPNGDGINDVWTIANIEQFPDALVEVYNRWGELLFSSIGYKEKWDCKYNNKDLPVGTYYYVINLNSDLHPEPITGPITILR